MAEAELLQLATLLGLGFFLGMEHALDADHVAAVSEMASQTKSLQKSSLLGVFWGAGHTTTLLLAGLAVLFFKLAIPERLALSFEFLVGIMLVVLGADALRKAFRDKTHIHAHEHGGVAHIHFHSHEKTPFHSHAHKPFLAGMLHGLAGSAALVLLVLASVKSLPQGVLFIFAFGFGSILGMLAVSTLIGLPFLLTKRFGGAHSAVRMLAGAVSVVLGAIMMYETGTTFL